MKIAIASDIHGSLLYAEKFFAAIDALGAEEVVLLGDLYYHGVRNPLPDGYAPLKVSELLNSRKSTLSVVRGNCDSDVDLMVSEFDFLSTIELYVNGKKIFCQHGDKYNKDNLPKGEYDLFVYGHYHTGFITRTAHGIIANSGSISLPKNGTARSFIFIDNGEITLRDLDGGIIAKEIL